MSHFVQHLQAIGIHGRFDIELSFQDGINIIHGSNGTGKTTLLHIIANAVNGDFKRFVYLQFQKLLITLDDNTKIRIEQEVVTKKTEIWINETLKASYTLQKIEEEEEKVETKLKYDHQLSKKNKSEIALKATYFPAFRTMIEAWAMLDEKEVRRFARHLPNYRKILISSRKSTELARSLFGKFVPVLEYPSPIEIEEHINLEFTEAQLKIASLDRRLLSDAFIQSFQAIAQASEIENVSEESQEKIIKEIEEILEKLQQLPFQTNQDNSDDVYKKLRNQLTSFKIDSKSEIASRVLCVYRNSLKERLDEQTEAYSSIKRYLESVNEFLERKRLQIVSGKHYSIRSRLGVKIDDEERPYELQILSSGERQIVGLIYAVSHMADDRVILIDEPEISLHLDWQRKLLPEMVKQLGEKQLIICTHSPVIASQYRDRMIEILLKSTAKANIYETQYDMDNDFNEIYDELESIPF